MYKGLIPIIEKGLKRSNSNQIVDLGSGGGGGLVWLSKELKKNHPHLRILLTDYFPNIPAFEHTQKHSDNFGFISKPVDARNVPEHLKGLRTLFLLFHHFKPKDAKQVLQNAIDTNSSIAVFDAQGRSVPSLIAIFLSPISVLLTTPFIRPFKIGRLFFTYILPVVPFAVLWDGIVSSLRTYSIKEMNLLIKDLNHKDRYNWEIGKVKSGPGKILYLLATKK